MIFLLLEFLKKGGHGTISVTSNVVPEIVSKFVMLINSNFQEAKKNWMIVKLKS